MGKTYIATNPDVKGVAPDTHLQSAREPVVESPYAELHTTSLQNSPRVAVCIATYHRPISLERLLRSIAEADVDWKMTQLIIADNDPTGTLPDSIVELLTKEGIPTTFVVEPVRGIATIRNTLVKEAQAIGAEFIAFVDDDVTVHSNWLRELIQLAIKSDADSVAGACVVTFDEDAPAWLTSSAFSFQLRRRPSGSKINHGSTANALFRMSVLRQIDGPFDERMNFSGGSDTLLFAWLRAINAYVIWCNESVVEETYPASRGTVSWILHRYFRSGVVMGLSTRWVKPSVTSIGIQSSKALYIGGHAVLRMPFTLFSGRSAIVSCMTGLLFMTGYFSGLLGRQSPKEEYRQIHGS